MERPPPSVMDEYSPVTHPDALPEALNYLKELYFSQDIPWTSNGKKDGVELRAYQPTPALPAPITRGDGTFPVGFSVEEVLSALHPPSCRKHWDSRFQTGFPTKRYSRTLVRFYTVQKGVGEGFFTVVSPRDFTGYSGHVKEVGEDGKTRYYYLQTSREFDDVPEQKGIVRGVTHLAGWVLEEGGEGEGVKGTYIVRFDPRGTIPSAILSSISKELPLCIYRVSEYLEKEGYPPHLNQHDNFPGQLRLEFLYDESEGGPKLEVSWVGEPGSFDVYFDQKFWKGARVVIAEGKESEDLETVIGEGKVTITVKEAAKGKALKVFVTKA